MKNAFHFLVSAILCFGIFVFIHHEPLLAQTSWPFGPISAAQGGAGRSSVDMGESYLLNPASIAHLRGAGIQFGYFGNSGLNSSSTSAPTSTLPAVFRLPRRGWQVSLNENGPDSSIATSIYYAQSQLSPSSDSSASELSSDTLSWKDAWFTLGNFMAPQLSLGLSYHFQETKAYGTVYHQHNGNLGFLWAVLDNMGLGLSLLDFIPTDKKIPTEYSLGSTVGVGVMYLYKDFLKLRLDLAQKNHSMKSFSYDEIALGLDNAMTPWVSSRMGFAHRLILDGSSLQKWTFGLGFDGPRFGIHYAFQHLIENEKGGLNPKTGAEHSVDFILPF